MDTDFQVFLILLFGLLMFLRWVARKLGEIGAQQSQSTRRPPLVERVERDPDEIAVSTAAPSPATPAQPTDPIQGLEQFFERLTTGQAAPPAPPPRVRPTRPAPPRVETAPSDATKQRSELFQSESTSAYAVDTEAYRLGKDAYRLDTDAYRVDRDAYVERVRSGPTRRRRLLGEINTRELRRVVLWREILGAPVSLRNGPPGADL